MNTPGEQMQTFDKQDKSLWYLLGLRSSLGFRVIGLFIIPGAISPFFIDRATFGGSYFLWFGIVALAHLSFSVILITSRQVIHGNRKHESHPVKTLFSFLIAQSVRGSVIGFSVVNLGFTDDPQLSFRIVSGGIFFGVILSIVAITVAEYDLHSNLVHDLENKTIDLDLMRESMEDRLQIAEDSLRTFAIQTISPRITQIDEQLSALKLGGDKELALKQLQLYVENELRPFSRQIAHDSIKLTDVNFPAQVVRRFRFPRQVNVANSLRPFVSTLLFELTLLAASQRNMTVIEILPTALFVALFFMFYFLLIQKLFVGRELSALPGTIIGLAIFAIAGPLSLTISEMLGLATPEFLKFAVIVMGLVFGAVNFLFTLLTSQRTELANQLGVAIEQLAVVVAVLRQRDWIVRRRVSYVMHGSLQSSLNAAVLKLGASSNPSAEMVDQIRSEISKALGSIWQNRSEDYFFTNAQQEITNVWEGTVRVDWKFADGVSQALDAHPITAECLGEVVREAISNASRHGAADLVEVQIFTNGEGVSVTVRDNGSGSNTGKTQGMGSELFNDVCSSWSLNANPGGGMTLQAKLLF